MNEIPRVDPELRKAIAREAGDFVEDRVFTLACRTLHAQWYGQLMDDSLSKFQVLNLVAKLRALEALPARLRSMAKDEELAQHARGRR